MHLDFVSAFCLYENQPIGLIDIYFFFRNANKCEPRWTAFSHWSQENIILVVWQNRNRWWWLVRKKREGSYVNKGLNKRRAFVLLSRCFGRKKNLVDTCSQHPIALSIQEEYNGRPGRVQRFDGQQSNSLRQIYPIPERRLQKRSDWESIMSSTALIENSVLGIGRENIWVSLSNQAGRSC